MSTTTTSITTVTTGTEDSFEIVSYFGGYAVKRNGLLLVNDRGDVRVFVTRNAARKRISRERRGNFHS